MNAASKVVAAAAAEKGYLEKSLKDWKQYGTKCLYDKSCYAGADNVQKYSYETGHYRDCGWAPWCLSFVVWVFMAVFGKGIANKLLCGMFGSAYTIGTKDAMKKAGREVPLAKAQPGDIVFRSRNGGGHVGIVKGWKDGKIVTIEGNSSSADVCSWNGGAVVEHVGAPWQWCMHPDWSIVDGKTDDWKWVQADGKWYYQDNAGRNAHGWKEIKETGSEHTHWYYFDDHGEMLTGWNEIGGKWYYMQPDGPLTGALWHEASDHSGALEPWYVK